MNTPFLTVGVGPEFKFLRDVLIVLWYKRHRVKLKGANTNPHNKAEFSLATCPEFEQHKDYRLHSGQQWLQ